MSAAKGAFPHTLPCCFLAKVLYKLLLNRGAKALSAEPFPGGDEQEGLA